MIVMLSWISHNLEFMNFLSQWVSVGICDPLPSPQCSRWALPLQLLYPDCHFGQIFFFYSVIWYISLPVESISSFTIWSPIQSTLKLNFAWSLLYCRLVHVLLDCVSTHTRKCIEGQYLVESYSCVDFTPFCRSLCLQSAMCITLSKRKRFELRIQKEFVDVRFWLLGLNPKGLTRIL